jgi:hypothetical protein
LRLNDSSLPTLEFDHNVFQILEGSTAKHYTTEIWKPTWKSTSAAWRRSGKGQLQPMLTNSDAPKCTNVLLVVAEKRDDYWPSRLYQSSSELDPVACSEVHLLESVFPSFGIHVSVG